MFIVLAFFSAIDGIVAFADPGHFFISENGLLVINSYDAYGLVLLVIAAAELLIGWGILVRARPAQWFGILVAVIGAIIHLIYFKHFPAWSVIALALDGVVIYALTVHGDEFAPDTR
jgi:hypothetical protein